MERSVRRGRSTSATPGWSFRAGDLWDNVSDLCKHWAPHDLPLNTQKRRNLAPANGGFDLMGLHRPREGLTTHG